MHIYKLHKNIKFNINSVNAQILKEKKKYKQGVFKKLFFKINIIALYLCT